MTSREAANLIGRTGLLRIQIWDRDKEDVFTVPVTIQDAREVFGRVDVLVAPVGGQGERWVSAERVTMGGAK